MALQMRRIRELEAERSSAVLQLEAQTRKIRELDEGHANALSELQAQMEGERERWRPRFCSTDKLQCNRFRLPSHQPEMDWLDNLGQRYGRYYP